MYFSPVSLLGVDAGPHGGAEAVVVGLDALSTTTSLGNSDFLSQS